MRVRKAYGCSVVTEARMPEVLRAAGVTAERVEPGHLDGMCRLDGDARVMAALGGIRPREVTAAHLGFDIEQWDEHGFGMYALVVEGEGVVGRAGLRSKVLDGSPEVEVAYSLLSELWGRGITTAVVDQVVATAGLASLAGSVVATVGPANGASLRVLEQVGFAFERELGRAGETMHLYRRRLGLEPWGEGPGAITADGCPVELYAALPADGRAELLHERIPAGSSVLDLGCGTGRIAEPLSELGHQVTAVDNSPDMLARLRRAERVCSEIAGLRLDRRFDVVVLASNLVNHPDLAGRRRLLEVAGAHLAPSGELLIEWEPPEWFEPWAPGVTVRGAISDIATELTVHARLGDLVAATVTYVRGERRWSQHFTTRRLTVDDLGQALAEVGLRLQGLFGPGETWAAAVPDG